MDRGIGKRIFQGATADVIFRVIAVLGLMMGAVFSVQSKNISNQTKAISQCQIKYNDYLVERTRILTAVVDEERRIGRIESDARSALFLDPAVSKPADQRTADEKSRIDSLGKAWLESTKIQSEQQQRADQVRQANPVPPPPSQVCKI